MLNIEYIDKLDKEHGTIINNEFDKYAVKNDIICNYSNFTFVAKENNKIIGIITGVLIYGLTISKYFVKINVRILLFFKEVIFMPIFRIVKKPIYFILINLRQIKRKTKKKNMSNSKISFHKKKDFS